MSRTAAATREQYRDLGLQAYREILPSGAIASLGKRKAAHPNNQDFMAAVDHPGIVLGPMMVSQHMEQRIDLGFDCGPNRAAITSIMVPNVIKARVLIQKLIEKSAKLKQARRAVTAKKALEIIETIIEEYENLPKDRLGKRINLNARESIGPGIMKREGWIAFEDAEERRVGTAVEFKGNNLSGPFERERASLSRSAGHSLDGPGDKRCAGSAICVILRLQPGSVVRYTVLLSRKIMSRRNLHLTNIPNFPERQLFIHLERVDDRFRNIFTALIGTPYRANAFGRR
ncbi:hypothetical protein LA080_004401 [Diaporthe eres]|nr:hypothetical protein LA080_004401 [Diaporthe eres]